MNFKVNPPPGDSPANKICGQRLGTSLPASAQAARQICISRLSRVEKGQEAFSLERERRCGTVCGPWFASKSYNLKYRT